MESNRQTCQRHASRRRSLVARGVVRSESTQTVKALARELRGFAQNKQVGFTLEMLVAHQERGSRGRGAPFNTSHQALLDYA